MNSLDLGVDLHHGGYSTRGPEQQLYPATLLSPVPNIISVLNVKINIKIENHRNTNSALSPLKCITVI